jgi:hypothetical protein
VIDLANATLIVDKALAQGRSMGLPPLTVAEQDEACAVAGIEAAGCTADTGQP